MRSSLSKRAYVLVAFGLLILGLGLRPSVEAQPADTPPTGTPPEPITGEAVMPEPGDETGPMHPFDPPEPGNVPVEDLTQAEQEYVAANADATGWSDIHAAFATASQEAAERAQAAKAAALL